MRIFITGATGAVGAPVAKNLKERGHEIVALVRDAENGKRMLAQGYQPVLCDMRAPERWESEAKRADALIHAAWIRPGRRMGARWLRSAMSADAIAVSALVEAAKQGGRCKALLLTSGHSVYGDHGDTWVDEDTEPAPGAIGKKQLACERAAMSAAKEGVPCFVLRPCTVYGPSGPSVDFFFGSAAKGVIRYPGDGNNFFPFVRDTDLAEAYALAIEKRPIGQVIAIGDDEPPAPARCRRDRTRSVRRRKMCQRAAVARGDFRRRAPRGDADPFLPGEEREGKGPPRLGAALPVTSRRHRGRGDRVEARAAIQQRRTIGRI